MNYSCIYVFKKIKTIVKSDRFGSFITNDCFDIQLLNKTNTVFPIKGGRGSSYKVTIAGVDCVLKFYHRGGLVEYFTKDKYLWFGNSKTRPALEKQVVDYAISQGLPVAKVCAYQIERRGFFYRAAIIHRYIANKGSLSECLSKDKLDKKGWIKLGKLIKKMHIIRINHVDLNANNILINDNNDFFLIDFDKALIVSNSRNMGKKNIQRLKRSLDKIELKNIQENKSFHFSKNDWVYFQEGYFD